MALTTLDERCALAVIDLQKGIVAMPTVHPIAEILERTVRLRARSFETRVAGSAGQRSGNGTRADRCRQTDDFVSAGLDGVGS